MTNYRYCKTQLSAQAQLLGWRGEMQTLIMEGSASAPVDIVYTQTGSF